MHADIKKNIQFALNNKLPVKLITQIPRILLHQSYLSLLLSLLTNEIVIKLSDI